MRSVIQMFTYDTDDTSEKTIEENINKHLAPTYLHIHSESEGKMITLRKLPYFGELASSEDAYAQFKELQNAEYLSDAIDEFLKD